jgi:hypothetical protein
VTKQAGLSKLGPENAYSRRRVCACEPPVPLRERDDDGEESVSCLKCGYEIEGAAHAGV